MGFLTLVDKLVTQSNDTTFSKDVPAYSTYPWISRTRAPWKGGIGPFPSLRGEVLRYIKQLRSGDALEVERRFLDLCTPRNVRFPPSARAKLGRIDFFPKAERLGWTWWYEFLDRLGLGATSLKACIDPSLVEPVQEVAVHGG